MNIPFLAKKEEYVPISPLIGEADDYNVYYPDKKERILWFIIGMIVAGAVLYIFYEKPVISVIFGVVFGFAFIPIRTKQVIKKRKKKLTTQFRSLLDALSTSIGAGRNMYDSFSAAADDLAVQYEDADIVNEVRIIKTGLDNGIQIEDLLLNFADRSGIEDIRNFANVFATCYKKGGNIKDVIKNTTKIIGDKIEIQMELETMVAGTKNEMNVMLVLPVIFIIVMKTMGGEMIDLKSGIGMVSVTIALAVFIIAFFVGKKITNIHF